MRRTVSLVGLGLLVAMAIPAAVVAKSPVSTSASSGCRVEVRTAKVRLGWMPASADFDSLQAAIDAAPSGATLQVSGTCVGTSTVNKDLSIRGRATSKQPNPTLDAAKCGTVLTVEGASLSITGIRVMGGADSSLLGCGTGYGGGIVNDHGTVRIEDTRITGNKSSGSGGGILNDGGSVTLVDSSVTGNTAFTAGGGILSGGGSLTLIRTTVASNSALMGGGIFSDGSTVTLTDSNVSSNQAVQNGGGILAANGSLTLSNSAVSGNTPDNCAPAC